MSAQDHTGSVATHTPGPWKVLDPIAFWPLVTDCNGRYLARVDTSCDGDVQAFPIACANARLIAAAPSLKASHFALVAALKKVDRVESSPHSETVRHAAREHLRVVLDAAIKLERAFK